MITGKFHCDMCKGDFETDEEPECHEGAGPGIPDAASICDDCYMKLTGEYPWLKEVKQ